MQEIILKKMYELIKFINKNSKSGIKNKILKIDNKVDKIVIDFEFNIIDLLNSSNFDDFSINFNNITFNKNVIFNKSISKSILKNDIIITNSEFKKNLSINFIECQGKIDFSNSIFHDNIELKKSSFNHSIIFLGSKFISEDSKSFSIENVKVDKLDFTSSLFNMEISFIRLKNNKLVFNNSIHNKKIELYNCRIKKVIFDETKFVDDVIISSPKFNKIILSNIVLINNVFIKNILFINKIYFNKINFIKEQSFISVSSLKLKEIKNIIFKNTYLYGKTNFENLKIKNLNLEGTSIVGNFAIINCDINNLLNWQTARILKHEEYKKSNSIKALEYHAEETKLYKEYLSEEIKNKFNIKKFGDILSICLSSLYSDNGLNWIKSFLCTILFATFFFTLSYNFFILIFIYIFTYYTYTFFYNKDIEKYIFISMVSYILISLLYINTDIIGYTKELFSFITPTNFSQILYDKGGLSYIYNSKNIFEIIFKGIFYFLGKIAFWYGSVQTVQSFRKFSKKE